MGQTGTAVGGADLQKRRLCRSRNTFWALLLLDVLLGQHVMLQVWAGRPADEVFSLMQVPVLVWALAASAYAFCAWRWPAEQRASALGTTDTRTGLFTMDHLHKCLECERQRAEEIGVSAAVVYLDLANLEQVNHRFGFTVGDIVLKALARLMAAQIRSGDILGRVGGDEFMLVMPETTVAEATPVAEAIRETVADYRLDLGKKGVIDFMECHAGVARFPADGRSAAEVAAAARGRISAPRREVATPQPA